MKTEDLLRSVGERGLRIVLKEGRPVLVVPEEHRHWKTAILLEVLEIHRERIIQILSKEQTDGKDQSKT